MSFTRNTLLIAFAAAVAAVSPAKAVLPYKPVPVDGPPVVGPGLITPDYVYGKEYSHDLDFSTVGPVLDPQQVIAWDGSGGTADSLDYSGTRPEWEADQEVDAIANTRDALYHELRGDIAHLTFSHDDLISGYTPSGATSLFTVPSVGPIITSGGAMIGGAGEVSVELAGAFGSFSSQGLWASAPEVNGMPLPIDVDGVELWGPEPEEFNESDARVLGDADKYSLDVDWPSGVSVWNESGTPYVDWPTIVGAVELLLGPVPPSAFSLRDEQQGRQVINLDALMVSDTTSLPEVFDMDANGGPGDPNALVLDQVGEPVGGPEQQQPGDSIIFSIRQVLDPADPDGYYATGSELFVLDPSAGIVDFLFHGGHVWDHGYTLGAMAFVGTQEEQTDFYAVLDINAIEAIGEGQAEPPLPGDYNFNGKVDAADYTVWRDMEGMMGVGLDADGNGDGTVDGADYLLWAGNFGAMASPAFAAAAGVPEPSAFAVVATAGVLATGLAGRRRR